MTTVGRLRASRVLASAGALTGSTIVTSAVGFAFWAVAAWAAPASAIGAAGAAIALMALVGSLSTIGFDTLLIGELNRRAEGRLGLVVRTALTTGTISAIAGLAASGVVTAVAPGAVPMLTTPAGAMLFAAGCSVANIAQVVDATFVAIHQAHRQLQRNSVAAFTKLAVLSLLAATGTVGPSSVFSAWGLGTVVSAVTVLPALRPRAGALLGAGRAATLRGLWGAAAGHHAMTISGQVSLNLMPVIVSALLGTEANARFYIALQMATFAWVVPLHLGTALFAVSSADRSRMRSEASLALGVAAGVAALAVAGFLTLGPFVLALLGDEYAGAAPTIAILATATFPMGIMGLFVAACRVDGRLAVGTAVLLAESVLQIAVAALLARRGVEWLAVGVVAPTWLAAALVWPRTRTLRGAGSPRGAAAVVTAGADA